MNTTLSFRKESIQSASVASDVARSAQHEATKDQASRSSREQGRPSITTIITTIL